MATHAQERRLIGEEYAFILSKSKQATAGIDHRPMENVMFMVVCGEQELMRCLFARIDEATKGEK